MGSGSEEAAHTKCAAWKQRQTDMLVLSRLSLFCVVLELPTFPFFPPQWEIFLEMILPEVCFLGDFLFPQVDKKQLAIISYI